MYGTSEITIDSDCEARAGVFPGGVSAPQPSTRMEAVVRTEVSRGNVLEARGAHSACPEHDLARPRVERLEELDDAAHRVRSERLQVDDDLQIVRQGEQRLLSGANGEISPILDANVLRVRGAIRPGTW